MLGVDLRAVRVEDGRLDRAVQELVGVAAEELVQRVLTGDVDRQATATAARAPPHLLEAGDRARERHADRRVELADVDAELERIGRHDADQLAGAEAALNVLALLRGVAAPVGGDPLCCFCLKSVAGVAQYQLDAFSRLHEADRLDARGDQLGEHLGRLVQRRAADTKFLVEERRVPHGDAAGRPRRAVFVDQVEVG